MKTNRKNLKAVILAALIFLPAIAGAVTQKEMEEARVIAAKTYIRYANDLSGYLDESNPTTLEELQKILKPKEKENIKAFLSIPVPSDYSSWDKQQLVDYWADTAFQDKSLDEKGRGGRVRARKLLNKMNISAPEPAESKEKADEEKEEQKKEDPKQEEQPVREEVTVNTKEALAQAAADTGSSQPEFLNEGEEIAEESSPQQETNLDEAKEYNYTWVYLMILGILVVVVIVLVVYAANVMKKNGGEGSGDGDESGNNGIDAEAKERMTTALADKDFEIAMLNKKLDTSYKQNEDLRNRIDNLNKEIARLKELIETGSVNASVSSATLESNSGRSRVEYREMPKREENTKQPTGLRTIYLGRANSKGIFVRADRKLNPGSSIFVLDTGDGFSGTFKVASFPEAWDLALSNPEAYLMTACIGHNLEDTSGVSGIVNEESGTAIFEGGCWRVIRKAKVRYE